MSNSGQQSPEIQFAAFESRDIGRGLERSYPFLIVLLLVVDLHRWLVLRQPPVLAMLYFPTAAMNFYWMVTGISLERRRASLRLLSRWLIPYYALMVVVGLVEWRSRFGDWWFLAFAVFYLAGAVLVGRRPRPTTSPAPEH